MIIAHLGIGLLILGITGSSVWQEEKIIQMKENALKDIKNISIKISMEVVESLIKNSIDKNKF